MARRYFQTDQTHTDDTQSRATERAVGRLAGSGMGLHPGTREASEIIGADERYLLLGPQTTPLGVTLTILGVMRTL